MPILIMSLTLTGAAYTLLKRRSTKRIKIGLQGRKKVSLLSAIKEKKHLSPAEIAARQQQKEHLSPAEIAARQQQKEHLSPAEIAARQQQYVVAGALGLSGLGAISYPIITLAAIPLLIYSYVHILKEIRDAYRNKSGLMITLFDGITFTLASVMISPVIIALMLFILFSSYRLTARTERETQVDFKRIFGELSTTTWLLKEGVEIEVKISSLQPNDHIVIHAGEMIPVDGYIVVGEGLLDQHLLTGEFQPIEKKIGDTVLTSTLLISGTLQVRVEKQGMETITGQIAQSLHHAASFKKKVQSRGTEIVERGATRTLLACGTALPFMGLNHIVALSYSGFGYQMRAAAPLMVFNYLYLASQNGILVKDGRALDKFHRIDTVVFDKTGTLTEEIPQITQLLACNGFTEQQLLQYAASAEQRQKHPIGLAICHYAEQQNIDLLVLRDSDYAIGHGLRANLFKSNDNDQQFVKTVLIGSQRFVDAANISLPEAVEVMQQEAGNKGYSVVYVASEEGELIGAIELSPVLRPQAKETIRRLREQGIKTYIISGDQQKPTRNLANQLGIDEYFAETLPEDKANIVASLQSEGHKVCFVGDGINDSVALQKADVSVSLHGAATIAQDVADIVLMTPDLLYLLYLIQMSNELHQRMNRSESMNNIAGVTCLSGVVLFGMGLSGAVLLYTSGTLLNIANAMLPRFTHTKNADNHSKQQLSSR